MEINTQPNVTPGQSVSVKGQALPGSVSLKGQDLPQPGGVMPSVEAKAPPKVPEYKMKDLAKAVDDLQRFVDKLGRDLNFRRDDQIDKTIITVMDANSNQVVRQIPSEEVVSIARQIADSLQELRAGLLMDDKA
jgi:flagellar protein FlaG